MTKVYLVGAGPGDPELLTLKARRLLTLADCILYDNLANVDFLDFARPDAERIYVGKKKAIHSMPQEEICALLVERGRRGLNVVRLKGGDPYLFGRGGEEAEALFEAGLPFEVVPGVTSPLGIAAYTGVPLTHRDHTSVVTFITGHDVDRIDWAKVGTSETLVIFMGLSYFDAISRKIVESGRAPETPAMAVRWATRPDQEVVVGTLATLPGLIRATGMRPPATFIVGEVVALRNQLSWFEKLPLFGRKIVVTRATDQADALAEPLRALGAHVLLAPAIGFEPPVDFGPLDQAIADLHKYHWLVFTSTNGVRSFFDRLAQSPRDTRAINSKLCAVGPATADALREFGLKADVIARESVAEGLVASLIGFDLQNARVLLARAAVGRDVVPDELRARGAIVDVVEAYRTAAPANLAERARAVLSRKPDWITFTSSSTVQNLVDAIGLDALAGIKTASIGPITSATLRKLGLPVTVEAKEFTIPGLIEAITLNLR